MYIGNVVALGFKVSLHSSSSSSTCFFLNYLFNRYLSDGLNCLILVVKKVIISHDAVKVELSPANVELARDLHCVGRLSLAAPYWPFVSLLLNQNTYFMEIY